MQLPAGGLEQARGPVQVPVQVPELARVLVQVLVLVLVLVQEPEWVQEQEPEWVQVPAPERVMNHEKQPWWLGRCCLPRPRRSR